VTIAGIAWNTVYMGAAIDRLKSRGEWIAPEDLAHHSPARYDHINPYGRCRFRVELHAEFARSECLACRSRQLCTRAGTEGREMTLRPRDRHEALQAARQRQETSTWKAEYAVRAGIEGTISEGVRGFGLRRCRYVGLAKAQLQHVSTAAAMNLSRLAAWLAGVPQGKTRVSRFARLALPG
jgi:Transposase DDE domain